MPGQKIQFPSKVAQETLERHEVEQQLRDAQLEFDLQMLDLKNEFVHRENKLRQAFLDRRQ